MDCGFVTFADERYMPLVEVLARGLLEVSDHPLEVFAIDCDAPTGYANVVPRRVALGTRDLWQVWYVKLLAALSSDFDAGVMIDADMVPNLHVDELVDLARQAVQSYPLCSAHPLDQRNQRNVMRELGVRRKSMPYVHATYLFSAQCREFFRECRSVARSLTEKGIRPANADETLLNVMLWKHRVARQVNHYDPYFAGIDDYLADRFEFWDEGDSSWTEASFHLFHGEKQVEGARALLERVLRQRGTGSGAAGRRRPLQVFEYRRSIVPGRVTRRRRSSHTGD